MKNLIKYGNECIKELNAIGIYPNEISEFKISNAKSYWGQARRRNGVYSIKISKDLLEDNTPEKSLKQTLFHELLHCVDGCWEHKNKWKELSELVNDCYAMNIKRTNSSVELLGENRVDKDIKTFTVVCTNSDCNGKYSKRGYRQPKWYKHIENYCCSKCHSKLKRIGTGTDL